MLEIHDDEQLAERNVPFSTREGTIIVYFSYPWLSLPHMKFHNSQMR